MGLSRLDNFLKSTRGTILYVDPSSLDSTDSIENQGNSLTRPFKTIQRALIEAARFSYQRGLDNDRFNKTTILLYPGDHVVDNRPGYIPDGPNNFRLRSGATTNDLIPFDLTTNFNLTTNDNELYKLNSIYGGVIIPRGVSIVGMDLRKTKIRPTYVPNPENDNIERSAVFRVTGGCYLWQFSILDADPNGTCYKDYTTNIFVPNFSHHKLTAFEYADGVNGVKINDTFLNGANAIDTTRTDLDMYYEKVGIVYGQSSGRPIEPDYPSSTLDIQTVVDEYRIVGSRGAEVGISSIRAGDGVTSSTQITVTLIEELSGLNVDTPIRISGVSSPGYDGQFVVSEVNSSTEIVYQVQNAPANALPSVAGSTLNIVVDTVTSASPYIFNCSLRSVYGMCGLLADGSKASGFKSMVVAQFTGIGLQKDDNAFVKYDSVSGTYKDSTSFDNLHTDSLARFKPEYENFHIKATNNSFLQLVSIFAIGYAQHFVSESGGDLSITNSNSNFGAKSLIASGFRSESFPRDDIGYITHIIPPKEIETTETSIEFIAIDVLKTVGIASTNRLYLYNETNGDVSPTTVIDGYRLGSKVNDTLNVQISQSGITTGYSARIIMPNTQYTGTELSSQKIFTVGRSTSGINSISDNVFTLTSNHSFLTGETIRVFGENGHIPDGLNSNQVYNVITKETDITLDNNQVKIAQSLNDALRNQPITVNSNGGILTIVSRVSDKTAGEIGHPVQWDGSQWYVNVSTASSENTIYSTIVGLGTTGLGNATPRTYITRTPDTRSLIDTIYRVRYVIPKDSALSARPPLDGYILQESGNIIGTGSTEIQKYFDPTNSSVLTNSTELRNPRFIANATWLSNTATITTELPHDLNVGSQVEVINVISTNNPTGVANSAFNGTFTVTGVISKKDFTYSLTSGDPGTFASDTSVRTSSLPAFRKKKFSGTYQIYRSQEIRKYVPGVQDGVYHLIVTNASNSPTVAPFNNLRFSQPIQNLYPQTNRDNPISDPDPAVSFALPDPIGQVVINDSQKSLTKESLSKCLTDFSVGFGLTDIRSNVAGTAHTFYSTLDHGLSGITSVSIVSGGSGYGSGSAGNAYNASLVGFAGSTTGENATAVITFDSSGTITAVKIMDGGSAYGIGNTLSVVGVATTTAHVPAVLQVTHIDNNINDSIQLDGIIPASNNEYNTLYKITNISTGNTKQFEVQSSVSINNPTQTGIGVTATSLSNVKISGKVLGISTFAYSPSSGIATVTFNDSHGFKVDNKLRISGSDIGLFNGDFIVKRVNSLTSLVVNVGLGQTVVGTGGSISVYRHGFASNGGDITNDNENISGRFNFEYSGITTTLNTQILSSASDSTPLIIIGADTLGFKLGDYIQIDDEIFRIKSDVTGSSVSVFRGLFGTPRQTHDANTVVRRVDAIPIELRRNSIIRASGHTFEYLGFGPGNYSTSLPERQDRIISPQEELIAQNSKVDGGISIFTAMNSDGDFYTGNKKVNSATGQEEVFDAPIPTVTGEEIDTGNLSVGFDVLSPLEASISRSIRVEGGVDGNLVSEFDGPVIFNNKITSTSDKGIETNSLFVQGTSLVSRRISISESKPTSSGNYGDVEFNSIPANGENAGWIYTTNNEWKPFGWINDPLYGVGISTNSGPVGFSTLLNLVGVGLTISRDYDSTTGITTVYFEGDPINTIGLSSEGTFIGDVNALNLVGSKDGFRFDIAIDFDSVVGLATVTFDTPIDIIDFKVAGVDNVLGFASPSFATTSIGTRVIYENTIDATNTNYSVGIGADDSLWWAVPQNNSYAFKWYGGETEIASLLSNGELTILGDSTITANTITAGQFISTVTTGTSPISVASSTLVSNLNSNYLSGYVSAATTTPNTIVRRDSSNNIDGNVSHLRHNVSGAQRGEWYTDIPARQGYFSFNRAGDVSSGICTFTQVSDIYKNQSTSGTTLTCDFATGPITRTTSTNTTIIDITNVPTTDSRALNYTVVLNASSTVSNLANIQFRINGNSLTAGGNSIRWLNNIPPTGTASGYYFFGFTIFRVGSVWEVLAVFATYA